MGSATPDYSYDPSSDGEFCNLDPNPLEVVAQTCIHSVICAFGLVGNALVIATYVFYKRTKTMTDVYLFNVAVADLMFVLALPFIIYNEQHDWLMGPAACKILGSAYSINLYAGMLLLACISCDRYVAIVQARRSFGARSRTLTYSRLICSAVWAFAVALTLPTLIYTDRIEEPNLGEGTEGEKVKLRVLAIARGIAYLHCCLNPILYAFIGVKFRSHFRQIMSDIWCFSKKYIYSARSPRATSDVCIAGLKSSDGSSNVSSFNA